ncbi:MAG: tetratricopeptide repeat protein [Bacteroidota bacterium]
MHHLLFSLLCLASLSIITSCGGNSQAEEPPSEVTTGPFTPAAEALQAGEGVAKVGSILMQAFPAVSDPNTGIIDVVAAKQFAQVAEQLVDKFPGDTLAALPFYRSAEVVRAMNDPKGAAAIYERVTREFPAYSKAGEALFMLAFTYDEDLNNLEMAKATYEKFIEMYPNNGFADDAEMLLQNLGKSDEEILKELEEKAKALED